MSAPAIQLNSVSKSFGGPGGPLQVLNEVSLTVQSGQFASIIGPSGSGKSTLFNLITGLDRADTGQILLHGSPRLTPKQAAEHCAYMPQDDVLFAWRTVIDNAILGLQIQGISRADARQKARELLPTFGLDGFAEALPQQLSGGMRQRVSLLRTVLPGKNILLLDEPFAALDSLTRTDMQSWLSGICRELGVTVLLITHDIREATRLSDRIFVLSARPATVLTKLDLDLPADVRLHGQHPLVTEAQTHLTALLHNQASAG